MHRSDSLFTCKYFKWTIHCSFPLYNVWVGPRCFKFLTWFYTSHFTFFGNFFQCFSLTHPLIKSNIYRAIGRTTIERIHSKLKIECHKIQLMFMSQQKTHVCKMGYFVRHRLSNLQQNPLPNTGVNLLSRWLAQCSYKLSQLLFQVLAEDLHFGQKHINTYSSIYLSKLNAAQFAKLKDDKCYLL